MRSQALKTCISVVYNCVLINVWIEDVFCSVVSTLTQEKHVLIKATGFCVSTYYSWGELCALKQQMYLICTINMSCGGSRFPCIMLVSSELSL